MHHLERQFDRSMSWDNYGSYWHVDHIIPCDAFDLNKESEQRICFNWQNLQPLEGGENIRKSNRFTQEQQPLALAMR